MLAFLEKEMVVLAVESIPKQQMTVRSLTKMAHRENKLISIIVIQARAQEPITDFSN